MKIRLDQRYQATQHLNRPTTSTFYFGGTSNGYSKTVATSITGKFDITSQLSNQHEIKGGLEVRTHKLDYDAFTVLRDTADRRYLNPTIPDLTSPSHDAYVRKTDSIGCLYSG